MTGFMQRCTILLAGTPPFPVVEVNESWLKVCGMKRQDVVGKTMKIIQGPLTEMDRVQRLMVRDACSHISHNCTWVIQQRL